jgi:hypothetical protein
LASEALKTAAGLETQNMNGKTAETWIGFLDNNEKDTANSVRSGKIWF